MKALCALALTLLTWAAQAGTLTAVDLDHNGSPDAYLESGAGVLWSAVGNANGLMLYGPATSFVEASSIAGVTGWRLPTIDELKSLYATLNGVPIGTLGGAMAAGPFTGVQAGDYWSSTTTGTRYFALDTRTGSYAGNFTPAGTPLYAWAVHAPVAEPGTATLWLGALVLLARRGRR